MTEEVEEQEEEQELPEKATLTQREMVATSVAQRFNKLSPKDKREFVDQTLTSLVNLNRKQMAKLFTRTFAKKGRPTQRDLETINQMIVVFIYSVRPEFRYHYASMIHKSLKMPQPPDLVEKLQKMRELVFLGDIGLSSEVYDRLYAKWEEMGQPPYDDFFNHILK